MLKICAIPVVLVEESFERRGGIAQLHVEPHL